MSESYNIVRHFLNKEGKRTIKRNLTLEQAQEHCKNPQTSSQTATGKTETTRTRQHGPWFDAYMAVR